jgi:hypothetical protein
LDSGDQAVILFLIEHWSLANILYLLATPKRSSPYATYSFLTCFAALHVFELHLMCTLEPVFLFQPDCGCGLSSRSNLILPSYVPMKIRATLLFFSLAVYPSIGFSIFVLGPTPYRWCLMSQVLTAAVGIVFLSRLGIFQGLLCFV